MARDNAQHQSAEDSSLWMQDMGIHGGPSRWIAVHLSGGSTGQSRGKGSGSSEVIPRGEMMGKSMNKVFSFDPTRARGPYEACRVEEGGVALGGLGLCENGKGSEKEGNDDDEEYSQIIAFNL